MTEEKIKKIAAEDTELTPESSDEINSANETHEEESGKFKWYAVRIISGHENKVKAYLDNEIRTEKLEDRINNVLIPLEKVFEVKAGKKKIRYR